MVVKPIAINNECFSGWHLRERGYLPVIQFVAASLVRIRRQWPHGLGPGQPSPLLSTGRRGTLECWKTTSGSDLCQEDLEDDKMGREKSGTTNKRSIMLKRGRIDSQFCPLSYSWRLNLGHDILYCRFGYLLFILCHTLEQWR